MQNKYKIGWITPTNGRKDLILESRKSWYKNLIGSIDKEIILDDSGDDVYHSWLQDEYPSATVIRYSTENLGYTKTMQNCFDLALKSGCEYILHTEDDFILNIQISLESLIEILRENKDLSQIALKRQRVYDWEFIGKDLIEAISKSGHSVEERVYPETISVHTAYWTANPHVYPVQIAKIGWPNENNSEKAFGDKVFSLGYKSANLGKSDDQNHIEHIGVYSLGFGH